MEAKSPSVGKVFRYNFDNLLHYDLDTKGFLNPQELLAAFLEARVSIIPPYIAGHEGPGGHHTVFVRSQRVQINPALNTLSSLQQPSVDTLCFVHVGTTSYVIRQELRLESTGELLATLLAQFVRVNLVTRRPDPLPKSLIHENEAVAKAPRPTIFGGLPELSTKPKGLYEYKVVVGPFDIDLNEHTEHSVYVMYCVDCAMAGSRDQAYSKHLLNCPIRDVSMQYINESVLNDELTVTSWEDKTWPLKIHFSIQKGDQEIVQCTITFNETIFGAKL